MPGGAAAGEGLHISPLMERLQPLLARHDVPVYLVGGAVRDALLQEIGYDLDFAAPEGAIELAFRVGDALGAPAFVLDHERDIGRVVLPDDPGVLDFARFRGETLEADLKDRDFTINAMALPAGALDHDHLIDPCGGLEDLERGLVRMTHESALADDPVRVLRALRIAARFGFRMTPDTVQAVQVAAPELRDVSAERVRDELLKLLQTERPDEGVGQMDALGVLDVVLPEVAALRAVEQSPPHHEPVLAHTLSVLRWLVQVEAAVVEGQDPAAPPLAEAQEALASYAADLREHLGREVVGGVDGRALLRLGGLFHDVGKARTQEVDDDGRIRFFGHDKEGAGLATHRLRRLHLSNEVVRTVQSMVAAHMRPLFLNQAEKVTRRAVYRFFRDAGDAGVDVGLLTLADHLATYDGAGDAGEWEGLLDVVGRLYRHYFEAYEETVAPPPLLDGNELMDALDMRPGPEVGRLLRLIEEAQAAGEVGTKEEALALAREAHGREG
ncbi:MAG: HDIG domain-containing protein [Candidatus Promineifilaceae bacterium]|nr:HDIG domain-containing protein [Candidatus Promineifilaceae bacterium]